MGGKSFPADPTEMRPHEIGSLVYETLLPYASKRLEELGVDYKGPPTKLTGRADEDYTYFNFIPGFKGYALPDGPSVQWQSNCFASNTFSVTTVKEKKSYLLTLTSTGQTEAGCEDYNMFCLLEGAVSSPVDSEGTVTFPFEVPDDFDEAHFYDLLNVGFRVAPYFYDQATVLAGLRDTVLLFECFFTPKVHPDCAERNLYFMENYALRPMTENTGGVFDLNQSQVNSGDGFYVLRLDGMDPTLAWAMGDSFGHSTVALWFDDDSEKPISSAGASSNSTLHICESTTKDAYWPTNGVQCTPFDTWIEQAEHADMNVFYAPLSAEYAAMFNEGQAYQWFKMQEGFDYGFYNMLWSWVDTLEENYPCVPPYDRASPMCLTYPIAEIVFSWIENVAPGFAQQIFGQAWNQRLGTTDLQWAALLQTVDSQGIPRAKVPTIVEDDAFLYNTTRYGEVATGHSMVCCCFVCSLWKHGGLFQKIETEVNCMEYTIWDDTALDIYSHEAPPAQCSKDSNLCQLMGDYALTVDAFNTKSQYPWQAQQCGGQAPEYTKDPTC